MRLAQLGAALLGLASLLGPIATIKTTTTTTTTSEKEQAAKLQSDAGQKLLASTPRTNHLTSSKVRRQFLTISGESPSNIASNNNGLHRASKRSTMKEDDGSISYADANDTRQLEWMLADHQASNASRSLDAAAATTTTTTNNNNNADLLDPTGVLEADELNAFQAAHYGYFRHSASISVILTVAYSIVFIVGIVGNSFVVAIVCKAPRMRTVTNYFIANLALADILVLLFCLPVTLVSNLFIPYVLGLFACKTVSYLQGVAVSASINTMVAVTMDRFLAICFPMDWHMSRRAARWTIACIWLFSLTIMLPWALYFQLVPYRFDNRVIQVCEEAWPSERAGTLYFVCANLILLYLFPATVIILCYLGIWYKIERRNIPGDRPQGLKIELIMHKSKLKVVKMMMVVVVIFLLSWLPLYLIFARIKLAERRSEWEEWIITNVMPLAQWLGASNSCINPILYTFFNRKYKRGFIDLLRFGFCCKPLILEAHLTNGSANNNNNHHLNNKYNSSHRPSLGLTASRPIRMDTLRRTNQQARNQSVRRFVKSRATESSTGTVWLTTCVSATGRSEEDCSQSRDNGSALGGRAANAEGASPSVQPAASTRSDGVGDGRMHLSSGNLSLDGLLRSSTERRGRKQHRSRLKLVQEKPDKSSNEGRRSSSFGETDSTATTGLRRFEPSRDSSATTGGQTRRKKKRRCSSQAESKAGEHRPAKPSGKGGRAKGEHRQINKGDKSSGDNGARSLMSNSTNTTRDTESTDLNVVSFTNGTQVGNSAGVESNQIQQDSVDHMAANNNNFESDDQDELTSESRSCSGPGSNEFDTNDLDGTDEEVAYVEDEDEEEEDDDEEESEDEEEDENLLFGSASNSQSDEELGNWRRRTQFGKSLAARAGSSLVNVVIHKLHSCSQQISSSTNRAHTPNGVALWSVVAVRPLGPPRQPQTKRLRSSDCLSLNDVDVGNQSQAPTLAPKQRSVRHVNEGGKAAPRLTLNSSAHRLSLQAPPTKSITIHSNPIGH